MGRIAMSSSTTYEFRNDLLVDKPRATSRHRPAANAAWRSVGLQPATHVHPLAVGAPAAGYAWFLLVCWIVFVTDREMAASLFMCTFISIILLGLLIGVGSCSRDVTPWMRSGRSWAEFLDGQVDTFTAPDERAAGVCASGGDVGHTGAGGDRAWDYYRLLALVTSTGLA
jgi:hypothetical protein